MLVMLLLVAHAITCCCAANDHPESRQIGNIHELAGFHRKESGSRCRLSGICDLDESERGRVCGNRTFVGSLPDKDVGMLFPSLLAKERDLWYECLSQPDERALKVKEAIVWAWKGYETCAAGEDELLPLTCSGQHWFNLTLTAVDSLDTLLIAGLEDEFLRAVDIIQGKAFTRTSGNCNVFETTIRILGGALAAYFELERDFSETAKQTKHVLLELAVDIGSRLFVSFHSSTGLPFSDVDLLTGETSGSVSESSLSEMTTLALEFTTLSRLTGDPKFEDAARSVYDILSDAVHKYDGLMPQFFNPETGGSSGQYIMLGARTDSYYEYLLKQWIFTGKSDALLKERYIHAMQSIRMKLLRRTNFVSGGEHEDGLLYVSEMKGTAMSAKMDHLVCFLPGLFALGHLHGISTAIPKPATSSANDTGELERNKHIWKDDLYIAEELSNTCYELYRQSPTGLAPEIAHFFEAEGEYPHNHLSDIGGGYFYVKDLDAHNILRPETVESLFILWKVTGDPKYRERSWQIFRAFERWSRVEGLEHCLLHNEKLSEEVAMVIVKECLNRITETLSAGGSIEDESNKAFSMVTELFEATRLSDVFPDRHDYRSITYGKEVAIKHIHMTLEALQSGVIRPGISRPVISHIESCQDWSPSYGYAGIQSILENPPKRRNKMESFWISETLKYFYLIFSEPPDSCQHPSCAGASLRESRYPLTEYVLNTEAHFLPIVGSKSDSKVHAVYLENMQRILNPFHRHTEEREEDEIASDIPEPLGEDDEELIHEGIEIVYDPPDISFTTNPDVLSNDGNKDEEIPPQHIEL